MKRPDFSDGQIGVALRQVDERTQDLIILDIFPSENMGLLFISEITSHDGHPPIIATFASEHTNHINIKKITQSLGGTLHI